MTKIPPSVREHGFDAECQPMKLAKFQTSSMYHKSWRDKARGV